jgi:hypothetical protein
MSPPVAGHPSNTEATSGCPREELSSHGREGFCSSISLPSLGSSSASFGSLVLRSFRPSALSCLPGGGLGAGSRRIISLTLITTSPSGQSRGTGPQRLPDYSAIPVPQGQAIPPPSESHSVGRYALLLSLPRLTCSSPTPRQFESSIRQHRAVLCSATTSLPLCGRLPNPRFETLHVRGQLRNSLLRFALIDSKSAAICSRPFRDCCDLLSIIHGLLRFALIYCQTAAICSSAANFQTLDLKPSMSAVNFEAPCCDLLSCNLRRLRFALIYSRTAAICSHLISDGCDLLSFIQGLLRFALLYSRTAAICSHLLTDCCDLLPFFLRLLRFALIYSRTAAISSHLFSDCCDLLSFFHGLL